MAVRSSVLQIKRTFKHLNPLLHLEHVFELTGGACLQVSLQPVELWVAHNLRELSQLRVW